MSIFVIHITHELHQLKKALPLLWGGGTWYTNMGSEYERPYGNYSNFCMSLLCAQALCFCCRPC